MDVGILRAGGKVLVGWGVGALVGLQLVGRKEGTTEGAAVG